jgi:DNA-nicking Smr family endonuclease
VTDDDLQAFRAAMRDVRPLRDADRAHAPSRAHRPRLPRRGRLTTSPLELAADGGGTVLEIAGEEHRFRRATVRESLLRRLRRGEIAVQAECDLHGLGRHAAHDALRGFIAECLQHGHQCVRVVHGKGRGSGPGGPVLRQATSDWLQRMEPVAAFTSAPRAQGGTGATLVLLVPARDLATRRR